MTGRRVAAVLLALLVVTTGAPAPAGDVMIRLLHVVGPVLAEYGEQWVVESGVAQILREYVARFHPGRERSDDPLFYVNHGGEKCRMSPDCSEDFFKRYGEIARLNCPDVPERVHPHLVRHTRSMHLKEAGMTDEDLALFLRHSGLGTVKVYAQASAKAKRESIDRANGKDPQAPSKRGFWEGDEDIIARLLNPGK